MATHPTPKSKRKDAASKATSSQSKASKRPNSNPTDNDNVEDDNADDDDELEDENEGEEDELDQDGADEADGADEDTDDEDSDSTDEDDDDEDDEDDEDEDDEDEDDEDEDEKPKRSASVASRQPEKAQPAPPTNAASKFVPAAKQTGKQATKQAPKPVTPKPPTKAPAPAVVKHPSEIALPSRNSEILIGLTSTIAAYAAFFAGTLILDSSQEAKHSSYFSNSAWVFLIAYFCIAFAATQFIRRERPAPPKKIPTGDGPNSHLTKYFGNRKQPPLETTGLALGCLLCGPLYLAYISKAYEIWDRTYADKNPWMWIIFAVIFTLMTLGIAHALRPPSIEQEVNRRIPTRRIVLLLMTPFGLVYGMIYFASFLLPWK